MPSHDYGKAEAAAWIRERFPSTAEILDVGACDGKWKQILHEYEKMDAVDVWAPHFDRLSKLYRKAFLADIGTFEYKHYDLIIFGDVIEHLNVETAQAVVKYAAERCDDLIVAVPYQYEQGEIYGNPYEKHKQSDLTAEIFEERYPELEILIDTGKNYAYWHKKPAPAPKKQAKPKAPRKTRAKKNEAGT